MYRFLLRRLFQNPEGSLLLIKRLIAENARYHIGGYAISFAFMGVVAATTAASAWIMKDVVNEVFINRNGSMVMVIAGVVIAIYLLKGLATYGQMVTLSRVGNNIVARCQQRLYDHILGMGMDFFDARQLGDLATRMSHNAQAAREVVNLLVVSLGRDLFSLIGLVGVMVSQNWGLSLIALVTLPPAVFGVSRLIKRMRKIATKEFLSLARIVSIMQETVLGARIVKAFGAEASMHDAMADAITSVEQRANKIASLKARTGPLMESLGGLAVALVILYGGYSVIELGDDPGAFFAFITALLMAYEPCKRLARLHVNLEYGLIGVRLMYDLLDTPTTLAEEPDAKELRLTDGRIRFEDVHFHYAGDKVALTGLTLEAAPGVITALVGLSGAGKSTVFALLERFYDVSSGAVTIDGQDVRTLTFRSLRQSMALVTQDTFLFDGSIRDNIAIGKPEASEAEIVAAAKDANAHEFIVRMSGAYDAPVGEGGGWLSGGQRQRIAIARAMLRDAPILLLDEATSALDADSEAKIQDALQRLMSGRTTIVIAHRLSTVRNARCILVLDHGKLIESGTHRQLLNSGGLYKKLYDLQFRQDEQREPQAV